MTSVVRGEEFPVRFSSSSEQCAEANENYLVGFFNYFILGKAVVSHYSFCSLSENNWLLE